MAIGFPNDPKEGDQFTASNGVIYTYENGGWNGNSASGLEDVFVNISGDEMTGDLTVPSLNGGQLAGFRNYLIGNFRVWQRGAGPFTVGSTAVYGPDRWAALLPGTTLTYTSSIPIVGLGCTVSAAGAIGQAIEKSNPHFNEAGKIYTFSVWANKVPAYAIAQHSTGIGGTNTAGFTADPFKTLETVGDYTRYSWTFTSVIPNAGNNCIRVYVGASATEDTTFYEPQFEEGPVATPFEHRPLGVEISLCHRYYQKHTNHQVTGFGYSSGSKVCIASLNYPSMRVAPTAVFVAGAAYSAVGAGGAQTTYDPTGATLKPKTGLGNSSMEIQLKGGTWAPYTLEPSGAFIADVTFELKAEL